MENAGILLALNRIADAVERIALQGECHAMPIKKQTLPEMLNGLIDGLEVQQLLKISPSTLYRIKKSKQLKTFRIGKRDYHSLADVQQIANHFLR